MTAPRYVVIEPELTTDADLLFAALLGVGAVVDRETDLVYRFGFMATEAAELFNDGSRSVDEGFFGEPPTDVERERLAAAVEALS
jgi:hypothetical protein